jgi:hypothetical protein
MPMVLITCPRARAPVPTGLVLDTQAFIWASLPDQHTHCLRCGRVHRWTKEDAYFPGYPPKPSPGRASAAEAPRHEGRIPWNWLALVAAFAILGAAWYLGVGPGQHLVAAPRP